MIFIRSIVVVGTLITMALLNGCGNEGSAGGNTVYLTASIKDQTSMSIFTNISTANASKLYNPQSLQYTVKSNIYPGSTKILPSDVNIDTVTFNFSGLPFDSTNVPSPDLSPKSFVKTNGFKVPAGGSNDVSLISLEGMQLNTLAQNPNLPARPVRLRYTVDVLFSGREILTNQPVSCSTSAMVYVDVH